MSARAEQQKLVRDLKKQGFDVVRTGGGHWKVSHPQRQGCTFIAFSPKRPPGPETFKQLRELGYERGK